MSLAVLLVFVLCIMLPISSFAQSMEKESNILKGMQKTESEAVYSSVYKNKSGIDYTLFSGNSNEPISINSAHANISGDVHTNKNLKFSGSELVIDGICESNSKIDVKESKVKIKNRVENANILQMPDIVTDIKETVLDSAEVYNESREYKEKKVSLSRSIVVNGDVSFKGSEFDSKGYIIASGDISFNSSRIVSSEDKGFVICSENGNITLKGSKAILKGVIYAPKGTVTINIADFNLNGRIIADKIVFAGSSLNVISNMEDYELINGFEIKEPPVLNLEKTDEGFELNWNFIKNATKYTVMRKIDEGQFEIISDNLIQNSYIDIGISAYGIYTYKIVASNIKNETKDSNEVLAYVSEMGNGILQIDKTNIDTDDDGLVDFLEIKKYNSDINNTDTDADGINDGDEVLKVFTDPTQKDTDANGITDGEEDFDSDGIINLDEIAKNTDPWLEDSDLDGLTDNQEIYIYNTNPNMEDTDSDGLTDNNEILQGTDPLLEDTDRDGIKDGDEIYSVIIKVIESEKDSKVEPSIKIELEGKNIGNISISNIGKSNPYLQRSIPGYIGDAYEFFAPVTFNSAEIKFRFDKELLNQQGFEPAIYYFNEKTKLLELLPNQTVDLIECTVSVNVNHFSTYILLNKTAFDEVWEKEMKAPFEGEIENIELVMGFAIDSSGSMSWNDLTGLRKLTAKEFVDKMDTNDKAAVIDFDSYAKVNCELTSDKSVIKSAIDKIDSSGGTDLGVGIEAALLQLQSSTSKAKFIIMLTDGEGSYNHNLTQKAINQGVKIYTIGLGSSIDVNLLRNIAEATGGKYYHASTALDLSGIFEQTSEETVDLTRDTDGDGISDYHEKRGVRTNTDWIYTAYDNSDTDGDGLKDGDELIYKNGYFDMSTDPNNKDSDNDGIIDNEDPEPMVYNITDRTLALAAGLSYTNLNSQIGNSVDTLINNNFKFIGIDDVCIKDLKDWKIVQANDSGVGYWKDFWDSGLGSIAIKISRIGKPDVVIFALRGTEPNSDALNDFTEDGVLGSGFDGFQSQNAFSEYKKLAKKFPNAQFYLAGHSLGGRLTQDILYKVYDSNDGIFGFFKSKIKTPYHSATFNGLGYNKVDRWLLKNSIVNEVENKLNNYYYKKDLVGEGFGASSVFKRIGTDIGPWTAKDKDGNVIEPELISAIIPYSFSEIHGINFFHYDSNLKYPGISILN